MGGGSTGTLSDLQLTQIDKKDPATEARQLSLWNQAQNFAKTAAFTSQYGPENLAGRSGLGMSKMSQRGQQYLANQILGPGQYGAQNLGFQSYERPVLAAGAPDWSYDPDIRTSRADWLGPTWPTQDPEVDPHESDPSGDPDKDAWMEAERQRLAREAWLKKYGSVGTIGVGTIGGGTGTIGGGQESKLFGLSLAQSGGAQTAQTGGTTQQQGGYAGGVQPDGTPNRMITEAIRQVRRNPSQFPGLLEALQDQWGDLDEFMAIHGEQKFHAPGGFIDFGDGRGPIPMKEAYPDGAPQYDLSTGNDAVTVGTIDAASTAQTGWPDPMGRDTSGWDESKPYHPELNPVGIIDTDNDVVTDGSRVIGGSFTGTEGVSGTGYGGLLGSAKERLYSQGVGIGEMEEAGDVTRRMLREPEPGTPGYDRFLTDGWTEQGEAGIGETPGFTRDATGNLVPIEGFGFTGEQLEGPTYDAAGKLVTPGYRPGYDAISGTVGEDGAAPFGVAERDPFTFGSIDPATGQPRVDPLTGFPIGDVPAVAQGSISGQTGYGDTAYGEGELALTEEQRTLSQIGQAARPGQVYDPTTGEYTTAAVAERIGEQSIAGLGQFMDPVTGELRDVVTPGEFGGASFLGGPAISEYMNQAGVEAQVAQARQDYEIALNREKARQAQVGAFGSRGTVEEAGLIEAQERNIAQIRGAGFERAADLMSQEAAWRQQAGLQEQQLKFQGESQAQQLGQQANIREAELGLEAARANQSTALASGSQTQQIQASRQMRQAELNLQRMQATQAHMVEAGMQQAGFGQQTAVRQTELDLQRQQATQGLGAEAFMQERQLGQQAAMASASNALAAAQSDQQAALASGNQAAALEAARRAQGAQAQMDIARQTQVLGADAAGQQAQLEAARLQRLSEMGLQAGGMGMDAQAQFRQQQLAAAQQLADIGGMTQGAAFGAGAQLQQMGAQQEQARRAQMAWDYEQWLRGQEGGAESLALVQSLMPGGQQFQYGRKPDRFGQILGAATSLGGAKIAASGGAAGSDVRIKDNIKYAGVKNGFNLYEFNYLGSDNRYRGVMAQEVMKQRPDAVESRNGVYWVDYGALGIQLEAV